MKKIIYILLFFGSMAFTIWVMSGSSGNESIAKTEKKEKVMTIDRDKYSVATVAGGCFWCMEPPFERLDGVVSVVSGYSGGTEVNPTYEQVAGGRTSHTESVEILFDSKVISYEKILEVFWMNIDPTQVDGQFADRGKQYRTAIFYHNDEQSC